mmetsp:Transcript_120862/g.341729  ORF Transcript_120862/g.341729 Transcript_120862/m.341729 type:complete len:214 (-) Transcript_120862:1231-1872(-)
MRMCTQRLAPPPAWGRRWHAVDQGAWRAHCVSANERADGGARASPTGGEVLLRSPATKVLLHWMECIELASLTAEHAAAKLLELPLKSFSPVLQIERHQTFLHARLRWMRGRQATRRWRWGSHPIGDQRWYSRCGDQRRSLRFGVEPRLGSSICFCPRLDLFPHLRAQGFQLLLEVARDRVEMRVPLRSLLVQLPAAFLTRRKLSGKRRLLHS